MAEAGHGAAAGMDIDSDAGFPLAQGLDAALARQVLEAAPSIIFVYDIQDDRSIFQNRRISALLGHGDVDMPDGRSEWEALVHAEDGRRFSDLRKRLKTIAPGESVDWDFRIRHKDGQYRWYLAHYVLLSADEKGLPRLIVGAAHDITVQRQAEENSNLLLGEMLHRAKNLSTVVEALGRQSLAPNEPAAKDFLNRFMGRFRALIGAGELTLSTIKRNAPIRPLVDTTLMPFIDPEKPGRITADGPDLTLGEATAGALALIIHELATNAVKYGALRESGGVVELTWALHRKDGHDQLHLDWEEKSNVPIAEPTKTGFGTRVIRDLIIREPGGKTELEFPATGARCHVEVTLPAQSPTR
jgi:PAS domain S-box-containing protein